MGNVSAPGWIIIIATNMYLIQNKCNESDNYFMSKNKKSYCFLHYVVCFRKLIINAFGKSLHDNQFIDLTLINQHRPVFYTSDSKTWGEICRCCLTFRSNRRLENCKWFNNYDNCYSCLRGRCLSKCTLCVSYIESPQHHAISEHSLWAVFIVSVSQQFSKTKTSPGVSNSTDNDPVWTTKGA